MRFGSCEEGKLLNLLWILSTVLTIRSASKTLKQGHESLDNLLEEKKELLIKLRSEIGAFRLIMLLLAYQAKLSRQQSSAQMDATAGTFLPCQG